MKMNMQDYRHVTDRIHIAEHCKEEVLNMTQKQKSQGRPLRIAAGFTAAAACCSLVCVFAYAVSHANQEKVDLVASAPITTTAEIEVQTQPAAAKKAADDLSEFPKLDTMTDEQLTRVFDWGSVKLVGWETTDGTSDADFIRFGFDVKVNDGIDLKGADTLKMDVQVYLYDQEQTHRVGDGTPYDSLWYLDGQDSYRMWINMPYPQAGKATCLTRGEDGSYHEDYNDFLEKQPIPGYLLYEVTIGDVVGFSKDLGEDTPAVTLQTGNTPLSKFRISDIPADEDSPVGEKTTAVLDEDGNFGSAVEDDTVSAAEQTDDEPLNEDAPSEAASVAVLEGEEAAAMGVEAE